MLMSLALISPPLEDWKFERKIEIVCPGGLGGGADSTIRPMATLLQQKLGVPVEVRNETGAGGVTGIEYTYNQPADGGTFMLVPSPVHPGYAGQHLHEFQNRNGMRGCAGALHQHAGWLQEAAGQVRHSITSPS
ncbi:MAG: hypothetical protein V8Q82_00180 [Christensenellales bacterium]